MMMYFYRLCCFIVVAICAMSILCFPTSSAFIAQPCGMKELENSEPFHFSFFGSEVAMYGQTMAVNAPNNEEPSHAASASAGAVFIYWESSLGANDWVETNVLWPSDFASQWYHGFGKSLSMDGLSLAIGASGDDTGFANSGAVYVFYDTGVNDNAWAQGAKLKSTSVTPSEGDGFARVSLRGTMLAVGAPGRDEVLNADGNIFIFQETSLYSQSWIETHRLTYSSAAALDNLGFVLTHADTRIAASRTFFGGVVLFAETSLNVNDWTEVHTIPAHNWAEVLHSVPEGHSISMSGQRLVVGVGAMEQFDGDTYNDVGYVWIYEESSLLANDHGLVQTLQQLPDINNLKQYGRFAQSVLLQGTDLFIGVPFPICYSFEFPEDYLDACFGQVQWYKESAMNANDFTLFYQFTTVPEWSGVLDDENPQSFGFSIASNGDILAAGAPGGQFNPYGADFEPKVYTMPIADRCDCTGENAAGWLCEIPCLNSGASSIANDFDVCDCTGTSAAGIYCEEPCSNGGIERDNNEYTCDCSGSAHIGSLCQTPCLNGGIEVAPDFIECDCDGLNFVGVTCETNCNNGIADHDTMSCNCTGAGATGSSCQNDVDDCTSNPCLNSGTCIDNGNSLFPLHNNEYNCTCKSKYSGPNCENTLCISSPCLNGGECDNGIDKVCNCTGTGYEGEMCETEVDDCMFNECQNGGTCVDELKNISCLCAAGYTGWLCDMDIDDCASSPCMNNGVCTDKLNNFKCKCEVGYEGDSCETNIDDCLSAPCLNGGTCLDLVNNYSCLCTEYYYEGHVCEDAIDVCQFSFLNLCDLDETCEWKKNKATYTCQAIVTSSTSSESISSSSTSSSSMMLELSTSDTNNPLLDEVPEDPNVNKNNSKEGGSGSGAMIGIIVGVVLVIVITIIVIVVFMQKKKKAKTLTLPT